MVRMMQGGSAIQVSARSSLVLDGDIILHELDLDGALSIAACPGASVAVRGCTVRNAGWAFEPVEPGTPPKAVSIRGFALANRSGGLHIQITAPGQYEVSGEGVLAYVNTSLQL